MTVAPGPQQPDEVMCRCGHDAGWHTPDEGCFREHQGRDCRTFRPAAPSAQPDEGTCDERGCYGQLPDCDFAQPVREPRRDDGEVTLTDQHARIAQPDEVPCDCTTPLPAGSLFYVGSHHQPGCAFYHAPAPAQPDEVRVFMQSPPNGTVPLTLGNAPAQPPCDCGHGYNEHDNDFLSDEGCLNGWEAPLSAPAGCMCKRYRPAQTVRDTGEGRR